MSRASFSFSGVIPILVTPFHEDGSLDLDSLERLIHFNASVGVDGVTILGVLGEANRLTETERIRVIRTAISAAGTLPVIVGTSHPGTAATIELCQGAMEMGAAAVMITPVAHPSPDDQAVFRYFQHIASKFAGPVVLQDYPVISQVHLPVTLILRLVQELPAIVAIKAEAVPSPPKIAALKAGMASGRQVAVLTGLGALYGLFDLERGSDGFNTGFAFPEVLRAILNAFQSGSHGRARSIFTQHLPLVVFEQQPGVAIRKEILRRRGLITSSHVRHPGGSIEHGTMEQLTRLLKNTFSEADITKPLTLPV